jgi:TM2 domain-containing membrane protein YozV
MVDQPPVISPSPKPVKPLAAWVCLLLNLFVLPGLGSLIVRQPLKAAIQIVLALGGIALSIVGVTPELKTIIRTNEFPEHLGSSFWMAIVGVVLFLIAWIWALAGSVSTLTKSGDKHP